MSEFLLKLNLPIEKQKENIHSFTLKNGLEVIFFKDLSKPKVLIQVAYKVGSSVESSSEKGLAHLVEHMIFKGTKNLSESDIDAIGRKFGAEYNAFTSHDLTSYYFETEKNSWEYFLNILFECMFFSRFDENHLASELKAVVQELNLYVDDFESKIIEKAIELSFPPNHPYHFPIIGFKNTLAEATAKDLLNFYHKYYFPKNAVLVMVGDFDFEKAEEIIIDKFNIEMEQNDQVELNNIALMPLLTDYDLSNIDFSIYEDVEQEKLLYFWRIDGLIDSITPVSDVFVELIGGGMNSRLYKRMIDQEKIAKELFVQIHLMHYSGMIFINILPNSLEDADKIKLILQDEFNKMLTIGFSDQELNRVKKSLALMFIRSTENWHNVSNGLIIEFFLRADPKEFFNYLLQLNSVSNSDLKALINKFWNKDLISLIKLKKLPKAAISISLKNKELIKKEEALILKNHVRESHLEEPRFVHTLEAPGFLHFTFPKPTSIIKTTKNMEVFFYKKEFYPITFCKMMFKNSFFLSKSKEGFLVDIMMQCIVENSKKYSKTDNLDFLNDKGAHFVFDSDGISLTTLMDDFQDSLDRILYMFFEPLFLEESLEKQKAILISDVIERSEDPQKVGIKAFYKNCYPNSELDWTFQEAVEFIQSITLNDIEKIHQKYCDSESFITAFSGSFDQELIIDLIEKYFNKKNHIVFDINYPQPIKESFCLEIPMLRDQTTLLLVQFDAMNIEDKDYLAIAILNIILFHSTGSKVFQIRERRGAFYSLFGGFALDASSHGSIDYICTTLNSNDVKNTKKEILYEIDLIQKNGITQEDFLAAKQIYLSSLITLFSDIPSVTQIFLSLAQHNLPLSYYDDLIKRLERLTIHEINMVANKRLITSLFSEILVGNIPLEK